MRKLISLIWLISALTGLGQTTNKVGVALAWDYPEAEIPKISTFKIYWGTNSGVYYTNLSVGLGYNGYASNNIRWVECLCPTSHCAKITNTFEIGVTYYFMATACDASGLESDPSNEVFLLAKPRPFPYPPFLHPIVDPCLPPTNRLYLRQIVTVTPVE
jgi:hypothetical protein